MPTATGVSVCRRVIAAAAAAVAPTRASCRRRANPEQMAEILQENADMRDRIGADELGKI